MALCRQTFAVYFFPQGSNIPSDKQMHHLLVESQKAGRQLQKLSSRRREGRQNSPTLSIVNLQRGRLQPLALGKQAGAWSTYLARWRSQVHLWWHLQLDRPMAWRMPDRCPSNLCCKTSSGRESTTFHGSPFHCWMVLTLRKFYLMFCQNLLSRHLNPLWGLGSTLWSNRKQTCFFSNCQASNFPGLFPNLFVSSIWFSSQFRNLKALKKKQIEKQIDKLVQDDQVWGKQDEMVNCFLEYFSKLYKAGKENDQEKTSYLEGKEIPKIS